MKNAYCVAAGTLAAVIALAPVTAAPSAAAVDGASLYREECGACHIAYPARALPRSSWQALMGALDRHFGVHAGLDPQTSADILSWLARNAGPEPARGAAPVLRITDTEWFRREHREIGRTVWQSSAVQGPANCAACHRGAARGVFGEEDVRIPR